jgi:hypothetical protein
MKRLLKEKGKWQKKKWLVHLLPFSFLLVYSLPGGCHIGRALPDTAALGGN